MPNNYVELMKFQWENGALNLEFNKDILSIEDRKLDEVFCKFYT